MGGFEEAVEEHGEFAHDRSERDLGGFAVGAEPLVELAQDVVMPDGGERGHVEHTPDGGATPTNAEAWASPMRPSSGSKASTVSALTRSAPANRRARA